MNQRIFFVSFFLVLCAFTAAFAQYDDDWGSAYDSSAEDSAGDSYESDVSDEDSGDQPVGSATASGDSWDGFKYEEIGLSQWEFQQAKEAGITRDKLTTLVELGIRPSEYLQKPWERLGVSEEEWIRERSEGMEDSDIDRSYRNRTQNRDIAYLSILLPSLYQWKTDHTTKAIWMDALWVVGAAGLTYFAVTDDTNTWAYWLIPVIGAHLWSFFDALMGTQWEDNPDANHFSMGIAPLPGKGLTGLMQLRF
ncbi:MAG: hypothetical protein LBR60_02420 [Fibrobacter sp.]|jgi:hypothetical protein|nr:hypothetical protein [Fibrobacter sp.]